ncbi:MAG: nuclear transport factor 2 family protein [Planctomycetota bacterium]
MDFLTRLFLESPIRLGVFSFIAFAIVLLVRRFLSEKAVRWSLPVALLAIPLLFAVQYTIVTQREEVFAAMDSYMAAVEARNPGGLAEGLSEAYDSEGMDRRAMLDFIDARLAVMRVYDSRVGSWDVEMNGDTAEMDLLVSATVSIQGGIGDRHVGRWTIQWVREEGGWKITGITPRMIDMMQMGSLRELRGVVP